MDWKFISAGVLFLAVPALCFLSTGCGEEAAPEGEIATVRPRREGGGATRRAGKPTAAPGPVIPRVA